MAGIDGSGAADKKNSQKAAAASFIGRLFLSEVALMLDILSLRGLTGHLLEIPNQLQQQQPGLLMQSDGQKV